MLTKIRKEGLVGGSVVVDAFEASSARPDRFWVEHLAESCSNEISAFGVFKFLFRRQRAGDQSDDGR